jgi:2'-5' RNA ligase
LQFLAILAALAVTTPVDTARLFFAAWPPLDVQEALHTVAQQVRRECGGRAVPQRNIHLTLAFLGNTDRNRLREIEAVAAGVDGSACDLVVEHVEYWRHNRILWAGVERCPDPLGGLVARLSAGLRALGFRLDDRAYVPHVTLLRNARRAPAATAIPAVAWPVRDLALVESVQREGKRVYEVLSRWQLGR